MASGQITMASEAGRVLYALAFEAKNTILEIGTWNALGSTMCIGHALLDRDDGFESCKFRSYEADRAMYVQAKANYPKQFKGEILHGTFCGPDELIDPSVYPAEVMADYRKPGDNGAPSMVDQWLVKDIENINALGNVLICPFSEIDLLVLDGGEFSTETEFDKLAPRSRFIFIDDTLTFKGWYIRREILSRSVGYSNYAVVLDRPNQRNGWMVIENKRFGGTE
jgi:hypothetical protein